MNIIGNVSKVVSHSLCVGCGVCVGACPSQAIIISTKQGVFRPKVDFDKCKSDKGCTRCLDVCPGHEIKLNQLSKESFPYSDIKIDSNVGRYLKCYTGYSTDQEIRYRSASGGLVSQFLIFLLERKYIDGAVVTAFDRDKEFLVNTTIATTKEEIIKARSSKYSPVSMHNVVSDISKREGKFVIVGLPCHIQGFRKLAKLSPAFAKKVIGYFTIYCSEGRSFYMTDYVFKERNIDKKSLTYFAYRDLGCLGSMVAKEGEHKEHVEPYQSYYHPLRSFFIPRRCISCVDHYGELGDICFGDIHLGEFKKDKIGVNSLVVRNPDFQKLLKEAQDLDYIKLEDLDVETLNQSQAMLKHKKGRSATVMKIDHLLGRKVPKYDIQLIDNKPIKSIISYFITISQMFIGKHKSLWFLIKPLKRKPKITG